nr:FAD-binding oxidoreductase [Aphanothece sacrum]
MTTAIASQLELLIDSPKTIIPWETIESSWKTRIESAIIDNFSPYYLTVPSDIDTLSQIVQFASHHQWSILPCGNGTKLNWGGLINNPKLVISTQQLNRIIDHAVGDLTITVEAGITLAQLQATLKQHNQFLPIDPSYPDTATLGGIIATADAGSWQQRYGGMRDLVLGLSFVRWDGKIAKCGGKVVKNVAGYDLMKLFTGSYGTLGMISQVNLRLYPIPEASGTLVVSGETNSISKMAQSLLKSGLQPTASDILSQSVVKTLNIGEGMGLIIRFQSIPESVKEQTIQVNKIAQELGLSTSFYSSEIEVNLWQKLQSLITSSQSNSSVTCKIGLRPNTAVNFLAQLDELIQHQGWGMINTSRGIGRLKLEIEPSLGTVKRLRTLTEEYGGFLTILDSPKFLKKQIEPWGYRGNALPLMEKIKQQFDPQNIFSPSRFF